MVGTQEGVLLIFSWGDWGDHSDRMPGHPNVSVVAYCLMLVVTFHAEY